MCLHITYMFTNRYMMYSTSSGCTRMLLHPLEYNIKFEAIWNRGCQPCIIQDGTAPNLISSTQTVFKFVHVIMKQHPLPPLYMIHLGKSLIFNLAKYGVWVHEPSVIMTLPCMLIKYIDMVYCNKNFMSENKMNQLI